MLILNGDAQISSKSLISSISWQFSNNESTYFFVFCLQKGSSEAHAQHKEGKEEMETLQKRITDGAEQVTQLQEQILQLQQIRDSVCYWYQCLIHILCSCHLGVEALKCMFEKLVNVNLVATYVLCSLLHLHFLNFNMLHFFRKLVAGYKS